MDNMEGSKGRHRGAEWLAAASTSSHFLFEASCTILCEVAAVRTASLYLAIALVSSASLIEARPSSRVTGFPEKIRYFELATPASSSHAQRREMVPCTQRREISFSAFGRSFALDLEPNPLFARDARNRWIGSRECVVERPADIFSPQKWLASDVSILYPLGRWAVSGADS